MFPSGTKQCSDLLWRNIQLQNAVRLFLCTWQIIGWVITGSWTLRWITAGEWLRLTLWKDDLIRALSKAAANSRPGYHSGWRKRTEHWRTIDGLECSFPGKQRTKSFSSVLFISGQPTSRNHGRLTGGLWWWSRYKPDQSHSWARPRPQLAQIKRRFIIQRWLWMQSTFKCKEKWKHGKIESFFSKNSSGFKGHYHRSSKLFCHVYV